MAPLKTFLLSAASLLAATQLPAAHVWVEGESGRGENISPNSWYLSVNTEELSAGAFLATYGGKAPAIATYTLEIPEAGTYALWVRANPVSATLSVRIDAKSDWLPVPITESHHDNINIASDRKPDMRFIAWTKAGPFELAAGSHTLEFRMSSKNGNHGAIDCFCLNTDPAWKPDKTLKPDEERPFWPAPELTDENIATWSDFIRPAESELGWRKIRWHQHLDEAAAEARELGRPILLWSMNGHPCGET